MSTITGNSALDALTTTTNTAKSSTLDQEAFLKLMTTQLKTQDPFNPVDNTQMVAQMAQFSSVAGISEMNQSLKGIAETLTASRVGDTASWIGHPALVASDSAPPLADGSYAGEIAIAEPANNVTVSLVDANGQVVHTEALGAKAAGNFAFKWDGKAADGTPTTGTLQIVVNAEGSAGKIEAATAAWTPITGVQSPASGSAASLVTPLGLIAPEEAIRLG
ncbi:flagellar hook assembly protein FlgD [Sphingobium boeckii]|uniref:Basal-body rod modification protein FlgD n=1 Tax=Sphingobium boeckii TaxID=1082345 RepID=A0A7W9AIU8_9SPHN|nr:flagellar hook capping FlgD N-terminal domain-containing protein [Sphingobium boeckii]MBB5686468.1 flagellar basal-body rod modification protein FlgD [Sphingobium boeckii]